MKHASPRTTLVWPAHLRGEVARAGPSKEHCSGACLPTLGPANLTPLSSGTRDGCPLPACSTGLGPCSQATLEQVKGPNASCRDRQGCSGFFVPVAGSFTTRVFSKAWTRKAVAKTLFRRSRKRPAGCPTSRCEPEQGLPGSASCAGTFPALAVAPSPGRKGAPSVADCHSGCGMMKPAISPGNR